MKKSAIYRTAFIVSTAGLMGFSAGQPRMEDEKSPGLIDPSAFDFSVPVPVEQVYRSLMFFYDTEFTFLVYPYNGNIIYNTQAYGDARHTDLALDFVLRVSQQKTLPANTPLVVRGKIEGINYGRINLYDAVIVSEGVTPTLAKFDLNAHDSDRVYNPREVYDVMIKWEDRPVIIKGYYQGYTQSGSMQGDILERRIDAGPDFSTVIGCAFNNDPGVADKLSAGVDMLTVKGILSWPLVYGRPYMKNCELVK